MNAIILSTQNKNLNPVNCELPDLMLPIGEIPCIEHIIRHLSNIGIMKISVVTGEMGGEITGYIGDGKWLGVENVLYCTFGNQYGLNRLDDFISDTNGSDIIVIAQNLFFEGAQSNELANLVGFHRKNKNYVTLGTVSNDISNYIGVYVLSSSAVSAIANYRISTVNDFSDALENVSNGRALSYTFGSNCVQINSLENYVKANQLYAEKSKFHQDGKFFEKGIFVGTNTIIAENVKLVAPVVIGANCMIEGNCEIQGSVIGRGSIVGNTSRISDSVCWNNVSIGKNVSISDSVICGSVRLERNFTAKKATIGNRSVCHIASAVIDGARLWPSSSVEAGRLVKNDMNDSYDDKIDFDENCIKECACHKRTVAETVSRLGSALGTFFGPSATVIVGSDGKNSSHMMTLAISAGLAGSGVQVKYVKDSVLPVMRWVCRHGLADGGVFISSNDDTEFNILNTHGNDLSQTERNSLQKIYINSEFTMAGEDCIEEIDEMANPEDYYTAFISDLFPEAYRSLCLGNVNCTREGREAVTAYMVSRLYPDAPIFVSASSSLAAESVAKRNMKTIIRCGSYRGDVMEAMEKHIKTDGVYQQYLMLYDDFAFELALSHFKAITGEDALVKTGIPNIFKKTVSVDFNAAKRDEIFKKLRNNLKLGEDFDKNDGFVDSCDNGYVRIIPDGIKPRIRITVESFDEEYAEDMTEKFTKIINECTE